jgi:DNA/RNA endonuclease YhcR with UshA esterase domain
MSDRTPARWRFIPVLSGLVVLVVLAGRVAWPVASAPSDQVTATIETPGLTASPAALPRSTFGRSTLTPWPTLELAESTPASGATFEGSATPTNTSVTDSTPTATVPITETVTPIVTITDTLTPLPTVTTTLTPVITVTATITPTATVSPTFTPSPSPTPTVGRLLITEVYADAPQAGSDAAYEWVELFNPGDQTIDLAGWSLSDNSGNDALPPATLAPGAFLVIAASPAFFENFPGYSGPVVFLNDGAIGNGLSNSGDRVMLRRPDGALADALSYGSDRSIFDPPAPAVAAGHSLERVPPDRDTDTAADFIDQLSPSPGHGTYPTPTPTPRPVVPPGTVLVNEVAYNPPQSGSDAVYEWIELFNASPATVNLAGWSLSDNAAQDSLPPVELPPGNFVVVAASPHFQENFPDFHGAIIYLDGIIGNGLGNDGDRVVLRGPGDELVDGISYGDDASVLDPPCFDVAAGHSLERAPAGHDTDAATDFVDQPAPSPGQAYTPPVPPVLNEFLPAPLHGDWDGDGQASSNDEWIELYNPGAAAIDVGGWQLDDSPDGSRPYRISTGTRIGPKGFRVFFKGETGVALNDAGDEVRLLSPAGQVVDHYAYPGNPGYDQSFSRSVDGAGEWRADYAVTPGEPNHPRPAEPAQPEEKEEPAQPPAPLRLTIAQARTQKSGTRVLVTGQVTAPPGIFDTHTAYVQDTTAGIKVYLGSADLPVLAEGDQVEVVGRIGQFYGERELRPGSAGDVHRLGPGTPPAPRPVQTGEVSETLEGLLVQVSGAVTGFSPSTLTLDDGSGPATVVFREATGLRRPWVERGQVWTVVGVAGQYAIAGRPGYRVLPRFGRDVGRGGTPGSRPPELLPVTGGEPDQEAKGSQLTDCVLGGR